MTKIYFIRHCEALGNQLRVFQGTSDFDISEIGAKQLEYLKARFENTDVDLVFSSPLIRAYKTAKIIADGKGLAITAFDDLKELDGGIFEGKPFKESFLAHPDLAEIWNERPEDFAPEGGESMAHAYERIFNVLNKIAELSKGKTAVVTCHGGVLRCLICRMLYNDIKMLKEVPYGDNTAVTLIEADENGNFTMPYCNDASHLPEELIPKRSRLAKLSEIEE